MENNIIEKRISELTPEYRLFVESDFVENAAALFSESVKLSGRNIEILENAFFFYLLSLFNEKEASEFISSQCGIPPFISEGVMFAFTASLAGGLNDLIKSDYNSLFSLSSDSVNLASDIKETEKALQGLTYMRTMSHDMEVAQEVSGPSLVDTTYQSNQADILRPPVAAPTVNETPRWDTE
jgi:hypothetical protein